jgi:N-acetyl sugar amidotransferase
MDTTHAEIEFDAHGVCNYCHGYDAIVARTPSPVQAAAILESSLARIRADGKRGDYDCILGLSGGVDSSYLALKCKDWGLRPLLIQFDNGWNSELAVHNIHAVCKTLGFDLHTEVVDWSEFRDLQMSFIRAGVANIEAPSDHGIFACMYRMSRRHRVRWVITGVNFATEACNPLGEKAKRVFSYGYSYGDLLHLRALHRRFGSRPLKTFPTMGTLLRRGYEFSGLIRRFDPLNYMNYNKADAIAELQQRAGWRPYPRKHFESVITRFHQSYFLPVKFGMDKRRLHLSGLIWSGQLSREQARHELAEPICPPELLNQDREYVLKKFGITRSELDMIMSSTPHDYSEYPNLLNLERCILNVFRFAGRIRRSIQIRRRR